MFLVQPPPPLLLSLPRSFSPPPPSLFLYIPTPLGAHTRIYIYITLHVHTHTHIYTPVGRRLARRVIYVSGEADRTALSPAGRREQAALTQQRRCTHTHTHIETVYSVHLRLLLSGSQSVRVCGTLQDRSGIFVGGYISITNIPCNIGTVTA